MLEDRERESRLFNILKKAHSQKTDRVLIFALYKKEAARMETTLVRKGFNCSSIHGDKSQDMRTRALERRVKAMDTFAGEPGSEESNAARQQNKPWAPTIQEIPGQLGVYKISKNVLTCSALTTGG